MPRNTKTTATETAPSNRPILISWIAWNHDYQKNEQARPDPKGPTITFHQHFFEEYQYEKHLLLTSCPENGGAEAKRSELLARYLNGNFEDHRVELVYMNVADVISFSDILNKVQPLLLRYKDREVHVYMSPGTPMMQVVWVTLAQNRIIPRLRLLQGIEARHSKSGSPEVREFTVEASPMARALVVQALQTTRASAPKEDHLIVPAIEPVYQEANRIAAFPLRQITTLIKGESGTGKENLALHLHEQSTRKGRPFMAFNCGALTDSTLESRLFGYVKGAFTGADKETNGIFQACNGGTLFLDEIGDISPYMQQMLLRVLQEGKVQKMGSTKEENVDVKVVTATHRDLRQLCAEGRFRLDLYYRLTTTELHLPALRSYGYADKKALLEHLLLTRATTLEQELPLKATRPVLDWLRSYPFPGNIRELIQIIDRWYIFKEPDGSIPHRLLPVLDNTQPQAAPADAHTTGQASGWRLDAATAEHARKALQYFGTQAHTAEQLGISVNTLKKHLGKKAKQQ